MFYYRVQIDTAAWGNVTVNVVEIEPRWKISAALFFFFFFRQGARNVEYDDWFLFHRDTWHFLLRGQGRETEAAGETVTQRKSFGGREWGYVLCGGAMHLFTLCYLGPRQMVWLSKHVRVCDMQILLSLHAYLNPSLREYSCTINILLTMECVCVRLCACVCARACVCVKYQL